MMTALVLALGSASGLARQDGGNDHGEQRDGQSRHEQESLTHIPVRFGDGSLFDVNHIVIIQSRFIHVTDTFSEGVGVDFENLNRADVSDVPLLGGLFDGPLRGEDLTQENRVGSVYRGGDGTLVAVLDDEVKVAESEVSVVNGDGRYTVTKAPALTQLDLPLLGEFGRLRSVQTLVRGEAPLSTTLVIAGLTATTEPKIEGKVPVLTDIPVLHRNFLGDAYEVEDRELVILIKPSIIVQQEE